MFYLPLYYGIFSRHKGILYKFSFFIITILPVAYFVILSKEAYKNNMIVFIFAFLAMYSLYEIGYLFNDVYTIKFENNPTIRLEKSCFEESSLKLPLLIAIRIFYLLISLLVLSFFNVINLGLFVFLLAILNLIFAIHNTKRGKINIITMFFIVTMKYITIPILFYPIKEYFIVAFILIMIIPVIRTIEYAAKERFAVSILRNLNLDFFRIIYYIGLAVLFWVYSLFYPTFLIGEFLLYFFIFFRIFMFIILKLAIIRKKVKKIRKIAKNN